MWPLIDDDVVTDQFVALSHWLEHVIKHREALPKSTPYGTADGAFAQAWNV